MWQGSLESFHVPEISGNPMSQPHPGAQPNIKALKPPNLAIHNTTPNMNQLSFTCSAQEAGIRGLYSGAGAGCPIMGSLQLPFRSRVV